MKHLHLRDAVFDEIDKSLSDEATRKAFASVRKNGKALQKTVALVTGEVHDVAAVLQDDEDAHLDGFESLVSCHQSGLPYSDEIGAVGLAHGFAGHVVSHTDEDLHPFVGDK